MNPITFAEIAFALFDLANKILEKSSSIKEADKKELLERVRKARESVTKWE